MFEALANHPPSSDSMVDELRVLIFAMRQGDERALEALYEATVGKVYRLASAILRQAEDAEDVVCATYAQAWENASGYDSRRASVLGWLLMMCRSRALDLLRKRRTSTEHASSAGLRIRPGTRRSARRRSVAPAAQHPRPRRARVAARGSPAFDLTRLSSRSFSSRNCRHDGNAVGHGQEPSAPRADSATRATGARAMTDLPEDTFDEADSRVFARLATALQATEISEAQRSRMRLRIRELVASQPPAGTTTLRATEDEWQTLSPLVRVKVLRVDTVAGNQTVLIRAAPGGIDAEASAQPGRGIHRARG